VLVAYEDKYNHLSDFGRTNQQGYEAVPLGVVGKRLFTLKFLWVHRLVALRALRNSRQPPNAVAVPLDAPINVGADMSA
jgi:hypothetical protein